MRKSVLIVDDERDVGAMISALLADLGWESAYAENAVEALTLLRRRPFDAVLSDVRMPGKTGIELVSDLHGVRPSIPVILMTAFSSLASAVEGMRAGAVDYITKPFRRDSLVSALQRAFPRDSAPTQAARDGDALDGLIGSSQATREVAALIAKIADKSSTVLITGESGTGKEQVARSIHARGKRAKQPFIPINCTAIPEGLLESELFGHCRGAFTGAIADKKGLLELGDGGTIFLDEIGDMGLGLQGKLLRFLQDRILRPLGGVKTQQVDVRIIAATNKDLGAEIEAGRFRLDLFYRLNVIPVHVPPLRERSDDIPILAQFFLENHTDSRGRTISPEAMTQLVRMPWKGNVRELENVIERALALAEGTEILPEHLPGADSAHAPAPSEVQDFLAAVVSRRLTLREIEAMVIGETLSATDGDKDSAARILGISRRTIYRRAAGQGNPRAGSH